MNEPRLYRCPTCGCEYHLTVGDDGLALEPTFCVGFDHEEHPGFAYLLTGEAVHHFADGHPDHEVGSLYPPHKRVAVEAVEVQS